MNFIFQKTTHLVMISMLVFGLFACGESTATTEQEQASETESSTSAENPETGAIIDAYLGVKDAFVASDADLTKEKAQTLAEAASGLSGNSITSIAGEIQATNGIDEQRVHFENLTAAVLALVEAQGNGGKNLYYQFCPMAFDNKGAYWISDEKEIRNPYFGDMMLNCGMVEKEL